MLLIDYGVKYQDSHAVGHDVAKNDTERVLVLDGWIKPCIDVVKGGWGEPLYQLVPGLSSSNGWNTVSWF